MIVFENVFLTARFYIQVFCCSLIRGDYLNYKISYSRCYGESSQPSYYFEIKKGFSRFLSHKSHMTRTEKALNFSGVHFWILKMLPMVNDHQGGKLYVLIF